RRATSEVELPCAPHKLELRGDTELDIHVAEMALHRPFGDRQALGDLPGRMALSGQARHLALPPCEPCEPLETTRSRRQPPSGSSEPAHGIVRPAPPPHRPARREAPI